MKVSLNIVKQLTGLELPPVDDLVARINSQLGGVEEVVYLGQKYKDAKIVKVIACEKHPNADKLSICKIDVGEKELVQVVCGAPNVHSDMWAVWLPPKSTVPSSFDDKEPFVLGARELRGVMSHGMLAAADELAIGVDHSGIVEITEKDILHGQVLQPGQSFAKIFGLDDVVIDIENKMFTHRPDLFGQLGVAREISAILRDKPEGADSNEGFSNPDWYWAIPEFEEAQGLSLDAFNQAPESSSRFMAVAIKDVVTRNSPLWLRCRLMALGVKPINNIVDLTNYAMLMTAQPTHAYDYDKLRGGKIGVRMANQGEKITLLNDKTYELTNEDVVIADGEGAIGLAGVMGGLDSEVTQETKNIVLEIANFDMYKVRKTSMRHGLFTDAVTRFNKGQSALQTDRVTKWLIDNMPGKQASQVFDLTGSAETSHKNSVYGEVVYSVDFVNQRLGTDFTSKQIGNILRATNITTNSVNEHENLLSSTAPFWRTDIEQPEDIVEEVGRLYGFDKLPRDLPVRSSKPAIKNQVRETKQKVRNSLTRLGANEVLTYSFVHENVMTRAKQDVSQAFRLNNALSPDLQYYRLSVLPSLLDKVHANIKLGHDEFVLFEIGKGHNKRYHASDDDGLPRELNFVDAVYASRKPHEGAAYYQLKRILEVMARDLGFNLIFKPIDETMDYPLTAPFDLSRSALVETDAGIFIGMIGELDDQVKRSFKLPDYCAAMSLDTQGLEKAIDSPTIRYKPLGRFPSVSQDVSLKVPSNIHYSTVKALVEKVLDSQSNDLDIRLEPISIYAPELGDDTKTVTLRLKFTHEQKTLSDKDVTKIMQRISEVVEKSLV